MVPLPLNIPTPAAAPDRGGPVACLGGPVVFSQLALLRLYLSQDNRLEPPQQHKGSWDRPESDEPPTPAATEGEILLQQEEVQLTRWHWPRGRHADFRGLANIAAHLL